LRSWWEGKTVLRVYNTLNRRKEKFIPIREGQVAIYVCGPTVYDYAHLGHAKSYVSFDVIVRYLNYLGYRVRYVQNITDVGHLLDTGEDRILKGAVRERIEPMELVEKYTRVYFEDMDALNVRRPNISPHASAHIPEQIELIKRLLSKGYAYEVNGSVYYSVKSFPEYGKLSGRRIEDLREGARVEPHPEKRFPLDFALWKKADPEHIMRWPSPWGWGYPGWHIECSAMSMKYLGDSFDIHGGGIENIFPHHECEIAQSEAATGRPFVRYWLHNGMVMVGGDEMHKSLGNFITLRELFRRYSPMAVRLFILNSHYRSPLEYSDEALTAAEHGLERLKAALTNIDIAIRRNPEERDYEEERLSGQEKELFEATIDAGKQFREAMDDDFNAPMAIGILFELARKGNVLSQLEPTGQRLAVLKKVKETIGEIIGVLGFDIDGRRVESEELVRLVDLLVKVRSHLRRMAEWEVSDRIRDELNKLGIVLEDRSEGTVWRLK